MAAKRKAPAHVAAPVKAVDFPENARTTPATQGMLVLVRDELEHLIAASGSASRRSSSRPTRVSIASKPVSTRRTRSWRRSSAA